MAMKANSWAVPTNQNPPNAIAMAPAQHRKIMLIGMDRNNVQERRFRAAGYEVVCAANRRSALDYVRHHALEGAVILSRGSALSVAETILSLKDLCPAMKIVLVLRRGAQPSDRFIRQLMNHPIQGSKIITRRELQKRLREQAPKGLF
jgi:hypothetical protein